MDLWTSAIQIVSSTKHTYNDVKLLELAIKLYVLYSDALYWNKNDRFVKFLIKFIMLEILKHHNVQGIQ